MLTRPRRSLSGSVDPRYGRAAATAGTAVAARGVSLALTLVTVPLTLGYLGSERYGLWVTISSVVALLGFADLGLGNGLLNAVTRSLALGDRVTARRQISSAVGLLALVSSVLLLGLVALYPNVPWELLASVHSPLAVAETGPALMAAVACFLVGQPIGVASQVRLARQEGWVVHVAATLGNLVAVGALLAVVAARGGLVSLVLAMGLPPIIASLGNAALLYGRDATDLRPSPWLVGRRSAASLLSTGALFLVLQLAMTVAFSSDAIVVAQLVGPEATATYGVTSQLFMIPFGLVALGLAPLWPAYGEAVARGDMAWVRRTLRRSTAAAAVLTGLGSLALLVVAPTFIRAWVNGQVEPPFPLIAGFGAWVVMGSIGNAVAMFLNGANELRFQALCAVAMSVTNLALSIVLTQRIGVAGVIWGTVISYGALTLIPLVAYAPRLLRSLEARATTEGSPSV